jgi:anti-anti-sigma regulatory factor
MKMDDPLEDRLLRLSDRRPARVTFDLSELQSVSSLAVGVLGAYRNAAVRTGARVFITPDLHPAVRKAFDRVELGALFEAPCGLEPPQRGP